MEPSMRDHVRRMEHHMRDLGDWPESERLGEQMRELLRAQYRLWRDRQAPELTDREVELVGALRAAEHAMGRHGLQHAAAFQAVRAALENHDPGYREAAHQLSLLPEPGPPRGGGPGGGRRTALGAP